MHNTPYLALPERQDRMLILVAYIYIYITKYITKASQQRADLGVNLSRAD